MPLPQQTERGQESVAAKPDKQELFLRQNLLQNMNSLQNILNDISSKLNHQILGNCDVLENMEFRRAGQGSQQGNQPEGEPKPDDSPEALKAFYKENIDSLIRNPVRLALGRLNGVNKSIAKLKEQAGLVNQ